MKTYALTVDALIAALQQASSDGWGHAHVVIKNKMISGYGVDPVEGIDGYDLQASPTQRGAVKLVDVGSTPAANPVIAFETPDMIPVSYWADELGWVADIRCNTCGRGGTPELKGRSCTSCNNGVYVEVQS